MLTSSPIAPRATTSASPRAFHYGPSRSPHQSPRVITPLPTRRPSRHSLSQSPQAEARSTPSQSKAKKHAGVDAGTQYSPMEPFDPTVPLRSDPSLAGPRRREPAPMPAAAVAATSSTPQSAINEPPPEPDILPARPGNTSANPLSPGKRRKSSEALGQRASTSVVAFSQPSSPKRSRPNQGPPKILPLRYEFCDVEDMVVLISNMLGELIETNDSIAMKSGNLTRFHSRTAPGISVFDYLHRLAKHATLTPPLLLSMVYYIDRLCAMYPDFTINTLTVHRFLITAATVSGKGLSDSFWNNSFYARVGGVKIAELKLLELEFLYRVDWKIVPNPEVLVAYYKGLIERCDGYTLEEGQPAEEQEQAQADDSDDIDDEDGSDLSPKSGDSATLPEEST